MRCYCELDSRQRLTVRASQLWYETPSRMVGPERERLLHEAVEARKKAIAPFSRYEVGAAILTPQGKIYRGCNIENSTYGLTICAERVALFSALAAGEREFSVLTVVAPSGNPATPCGACRQVLWEHCGDITVIVATVDGAAAEHRLSALLPHPFEFRGPA